MDAKVIDMGAYDLVLGMNWLEKFRPIVCGWLEKWIEFPMNTSVVRLQEISVEQVMKWEKGNELWVAML
jgi:hypothetical protein